MMDGDSHLTAPWASNCSGQKRNVFPVIPAETLGLMLINSDWLTVDNIPTLNPSPNQGDVCGPTAGQDRDRINTPHT